MKNKKDKKNDLTATRMENTTAQNSNTFEMSDDSLSDVAGGGISYEDKFFYHRWVVRDDQTKKKLREFKSRDDAKAYYDKIKKK